MWDICGDLKVVTILMGIQFGYKNYFKKAQIMIEQDSNTFTKTFQASGVKRLDQQGNINAFKELKVVLLVLTCPNS